VYVKFLGGISGSQLQLKRLEPFLVKMIPIKKQRRLTINEMMERWIDVTEQPIQRPIKRSA
jgi:hypothetical protein